MQGLATRGNRTRNPWRPLPWTRRRPLSSTADCAPTPAAAASSRERPSPTSCPAALPPCRPATLLPCCRHRLFARAAITTWPLHARPRLLEQVEQAEGRACDRLRAAVTRRLGGGEGWPGGGQGAARGRPGGSPGGSPGGLPGVAFACSPSSMASASGDGAEGASKRRPAGAGAGAGAGSSLLKLPRRRAGVEGAGEKGWSHGGYSGG